MSRSETGPGANLVRKGILVVILVTVVCVLGYDRLVASRQYQAAVDRLEAELDGADTNENLSGEDISEILGRQPAEKTDYQDHRAIVERYEWSRGFPGVSYELNIIYSKPYGSDRYFLDKYVQGSLKEEHLPKGSNAINIVYNPPTPRAMVVGGGGTESPEAAASRAAERSGDSDQSGSGDSSDNQ